MNTHPVRTIGIVTFQRARNYGALLQAFALQEALKSLGTAPVFIDYQYRFEHQTPKPGKGLKGRLLSLFVLCRDAVAGIPFDRFGSKFLQRTPKKYWTLRELETSAPDVGMLICGSDQIWNPAHTVYPEDESVSWLRFGSAEVPRIAYAASFGVSNLPEVQRERWRSFLADFRRMGVREESGVALVRDLGRDDVDWVPDPTQLMDPKAYQKLFPGNLDQAAAGVFSFYLGNKRVGRLGQEAGRILGQASLDACPSSLKWLAKGGYAGPGEWLRRLATSMFVVTDSYHATSFAILFHRPFIVMADNRGGQSRNSRMVSLLDRLGLSNRILDVFDPEVAAALLREPIDWAGVDAKREMFRETGMDFLRRAVAEVFE